MRISPPAGFHWPPSVLLVTVVLVTGGLLLVAAIAMRRKSITPGGAAGAQLLLLIAAVWNAGIIFMFMSPHNRHVFHLSTHRISVVVNAVLGIFWFSLCVFGVARWFRQPDQNSQPA